MKNCLRFLAILSAAGCLASACGPADTSSDGSGGNRGSGGSGSGGSSSGGAVGSGGSSSGGSGSGGAVGSGGSASGGSSSGGSNSGGAVGSGGSATGGGEGGRGAVGGAGGGAVGGRPAGGSSGSGGSNAGGGASGSYNPCPTNGDPCRILPVGDSITFGQNQEGSYRIELFHKALMAKQKITYTGTLQNGPTMVDMMPFPRRHEATGGITIDGISNQITKNKTLDMPADIILVHIGTNDMYMSNPDGAPMRLGTLLDKLIAGMPNALIVVAKIIPMLPFPAAVNKFNAAIPAIVQTRAAAGKHITLIDLNTAFPSGYLGSDGVHPNVMGYAWMGDRWYDAINALFPK